MVKSRDHGLIESSILKVNVTPLADGCRDRHSNSYFKKLRMDESMRLAHEERISKKRACLWRTIILSSLGTPDLSSKLDEYIKLFFRLRKCRGLLQGELAQFKVDEEYDILNLENTMNKIGQGENT